MSTHTTFTPQQQRMAALERAQHVRMTQCEAARAIARGELTIRAAMDIPELATIPIYRLLMARPRCGRTKTMRILRNVRVSEGRKLKMVTPRERAAILTEIGEA